MQITKDAIAGTLESSDAQIRIAPHSSLEIELNSSVGKQFGASTIQCHCSKNYC